MKGIRVCCDDYPKKEELLVQTLHSLLVVSPHKNMKVAIIKKKDKKRKGVKKK